MNTHRPTPTTSYSLRSTIPSSTSRVTWVTGDVQRRTVQFIQDTLGWHPMFDYLFLNGSLSKMTPQPSSSFSLTFLCQGDFRLQPFVVRRWLGYKVKDSVPEPDRDIISPCKYEGVLSLILTFQCTVSRFLVPLYYLTPIIKSDGGTRENVLLWD